MPNDTQPQSFRQRIDAIYDEMLENAVTKDEVREVMDVFIEKFKELSTFVSEKTAENNAEMKTETERLGKEVADFEKRVRGLIDKGDTDTRKELDTLANELRAEIGYVESLIEYYDDEEVRGRLEALNTNIEDVRKSIPEQFDATELEERVKENKKDIEDLKKRPVGRGGGTSAMGVAQTFKYIAHTEEPSGDIDGANTEYTVKNNIWWIAGFTLNGEQVAELPNFTYANKTITFSSALPAAYDGKDFEVKYIGF